MATGIIKFDIRGMEELQAIARFVREVVEVIEPWMSAPPRLEDDWPDRAHILSALSRIWERWGKDRGLLESLFPPDVGSPEVGAALAAAERVVRVRSGDDWRERWATGSVTTGRGPCQEYRLKEALGELLEAMAKVPPAEAGRRNDDGI